MGDCMKIGIALSGGGMKGIAHAGVLKALEENDIKIDIIGGTSAGSMIASLYAIGYKPDEIYNLFQENYRKIIGESRFYFLDGIKNLVDKKTTLKGFKKGENIEKVFDTLAKNKNIESIRNIKMPIVIPTVDILDAKEYVFTNMIPNKDANMEVQQNINYEEKYITDINIGKAVRASSSFPAVFNLCKMEQHAFMDGGALDNIPVDEVRKQGADKIIAVRFDEENFGVDSNVMDIIMRTIDIMGNKIIEKEIENSDYVLNIHTEKVGLLETNKIYHCFEYGYEAAQSNMEQIKKCLGED